MQFKKEEVKNRILKEAELEFLNNGFEKASLRRIVKNAGTTIGNFYNYFVNKEELFKELVIKDYEGFIYLIKNHNNETHYDMDFNLLKNTQSIKDALYDSIDELMPLFSDGFLLLLEYSDKTEFQNSKEILKEFIKRHLSEHISDLKNTNIDKEYFPDILASQFLDGIVYILKKYKDQKIRKQMIVELIMFYCIGIMGL